ncbi:MAG: hypothetical protein ACI9LM_001065 [Alteromonadaceae bacterium]|jgi:hypothetical protein
MQIFEDDPTISPIYHRALRLVISKDFAEQTNGKFQITPQQDGEQHNRRRELLEVEEETNRTKIIEQYGQSHFKEQMLAQFYARVQKEVNQALDNKENLYNNILKVEDAAASIMELLSVKAASIKRIIPLIQALPWLADELIALVNKPQYRKRADVRVTDASLAISYIGLDNLKLVVPTFILKHWLPTSTSPYPLMKRKLWNEGLSIALASSVLANQEGLDAFSGFAAGMLSNFGLIAVTRCFVHTYNEIYKRELREAHEARDKRLHDIMVEFDSSPQLLHEQLLMRSSHISAEMVELMRFDRLPITEIMFDLAHTTDIKKMCPLARIITQAKTYVTFRSLAKEELIDNEEALALFSAVNLSKKNISLLKKSDIDHIKLQFK